MTGIVGSIALGGIVGKAKGILGSIPWQIWAVIAGATLLELGSCVHGHKVKAFGKEQYQAGVKAEHDHVQAQFDKEHKDAMAWKAKTEALQAQISQDIRGRNEEDLRTHGATAADQRLRGPGKATCGGQGNNPGISASASQHEPASGNADAAGSSLPANDRAAVPWSWLTDRAQQCDDNRSESLSWREWYARQSVQAIPR